MGSIYTPDPITIVRGEDSSITITVTDASGAPQDITGLRVYFTMKQRWDDVTPLILKKSVAAGGAAEQINILAQTGATLGKADILIVAADTLALKPYDYYTCDAWAILGSNQRARVIKRRRFIIEPNVTVLP